MGKQEKLTVNFKLEGRDPATLGDQIKITPGIDRDSVQSDGNGGLNVTGDKSAIEGIAGTLRLEVKF